MDVVGEKMDKLIEEAKVLDIKVEEGVTEEDLQAAIDAKKEELNNDADWLRQRVEYLEEESKKAYDKRDSINKDKGMLSDELKRVKEQLKDSPDKDEFSKLQDKLKTLEGFKKEIDDAEEKKILDKADDTERAKLSFEKQMQALEDKMDAMKDDSVKERKDLSGKLKQAEKQISNLRTTTLDSEIIRAASKVKAWSPDQIIDLTKKYFTYDANLDKFTHIVRDSDNKLVDEKTVEEFITEYLTKEENANLVRGEHQEASFGMQGSHSNKHKGSKAKKHGYDLKSTEFIAEADSKGLKPEDWADIKHKMELKLKKKKEE